MKNYLPYFLFILVLIAVDIYAFKSLKLVTLGWMKPMWRTSLQVLYWLTTASTYALMIYALATYRNAMSHHNYYFVYMAFGALILLFIPKLIIVMFHLADDLIQFFRVVTQWFVHNTEDNSYRATSNSITRWQFLSKTGWVVATLPFTGMLYGFIRGRFRFRIERQTLSFPHLPASFDGLKIVQLSDIHIGSFLFTGDMINNYAAELDGWEEVLGQLKAKMGKYAILGNHDYGDYSDWPSEEAKAENLKSLKDRLERLGFQMLNNTWVPIRSSAGEVIELIGSENWGTGRFSKYGDLKKAMEGTQPERMQILMTHDPSHWDAQVRPDTDVDLTLSGHTHGMQVGIEIPGFVKWSPAKYRYKHWAGLYREGSQLLYVNRGFGYIGFPARVGIWPEITLFELKRG